MKKVVLLSAPLKNKYHSKYETMYILHTLESGVKRVNFLVPQFYLKNFQFLLNSRKERDSSGLAFHNVKWRGSNKERILTHPHTLIHTHTFKSESYLSVLSSSDLSSSSKTSTGMPSMKYSKIRHNFIYTYTRCLLNNLSITSLFLESLNIPTFKLKCKCLFQSILQMKQPIPPPTQHITINMTNSSTQPCALSFKYWWYFRMKWKKVKSFNSGVGLSAASDDLWLGGNKAAGKVLLILEYRQLGLL